MATNNSTQIEELLEATHKKYLMEYLPIIVLMCITTAMGIVGNIFTLLFYGSVARKTSTIVFIIALAALDLTVCFMAITTIADMSVNVYFSGPYLCKFMYFFDHWTVVSSVLVLWIISIDRYRKICKPFRRQFKIKSALISIAVLIGISLGLAVPCLIMYDILSVKLTAPDGSRVYGNYCTNTDKAELQWFVTTAHVCDCLTIVFVFVTFVVTYGKIWSVLRKHQKQIGKMTSPTVRASKEISSLERPVESTTTTIQKSASCDSFDPNNKTMLSLRMGQDSTNDISTTSGNFLTVPKPLAVSTASVATSDKRKADTKGIPSRAERNITIMMLAVSVGYVCCFTPYFIVSGIRILTLAGEAEMKGWVQFMLRGPFYNSIINPVIFCFFNPQFRKYIKETILWCKVGQYVFSSTST